MNKLFKFALCAVAVIQSAFTSSMRAQDAAIDKKDVNITWSFDKGVDNVSAATISETGLLSYANAEVGTLLSYFGVRAAGTVNMSELQPIEAVSTDTDGNAIIMAIKPKNGLTFAPRSISFDACKIGTNGGAFDVIAYCKDQRFVLAENVNPQLIKEAPYYSSYQYDLQAIGATAEEITIKVYIKNIAINKQYGFANFVVIGDVAGTVIEIPSYTLDVTLSDNQAGSISISPNGNSFDAGTPITLLASENFGYHFINWVDANGRIVSDKNPYTFNIESDTQLQAVYYLNNVYALDLSMTDGAKSNSVNVLPMGNLVNGIHYYEEGTEVKMTAVNNKILTFTNWEDNTTPAERTLVMNEDKNVVAHFSACDYIVGWDLYDMNIRQDRAGDYASESENAGLLQLRNAAGSSYSWLGSIMNGKYSARVWRNLSENDYFEISFSTNGYSHVKVSAAVGDDYNAYSVNTMQVSLDGTNYTTVGTYRLPNRGWDEKEFALPDSCSHQTKVWVRFMPDTTSPLTGVSSDYDGTGVADIFVTAESDVKEDTIAPVLVSSNPIQGATDVSASGSIILTFDEKVKNGIGQATLNGENLDAIVSGKNVIFNYSGLDYHTDYLFTLPQGVITDRNGNAFEGCTLAFKTLERLQPTSRLFDAIVAKDGSGDYLTIQDAIDAAPTNRVKPWLIFVKKGVYTGHHDIPANKPYIHIIGQSRDLVSISDNRLSGGNDAYPVQTGATFVANSDNLYFEGINFVNSWGVEQNNGPQALALYTIGDRVVLNKVGLLSYQDTWLTTTHANYRHYIKDSWIEGAVDFIYGQGNVYLDQDTINIVRKSGGYIVAPNHDPSTTWGYVFMNNVITAPGVPSETNVWLGRPWHAEPKTVFINTKSEVTIPAAGWFNHMGGLPKLWAEYNTMDGKGNPVDLSNRIVDYYYTEGNDTIWGKSDKAVLSAEEAAQYTLKNVLSGSDNWQPTLITEACVAPVVMLNEAELTWDAVDYAICYVVTQNDCVIGFTQDTHFDVSNVANASAVNIYKVQAVNEFGGLSAYGTATIQTGVTSIECSENESNEVWYNLMGQRVQTLDKGFYMNSKKKIYVK